MASKLIRLTHARDNQPVLVQPERVISVVCPRKFPDAEQTAGMTIVQEGYAAPIGAVLYLDGGPSRGIPVVESFDAVETVVNDHLKTYPVGC